MRSLLMLILLASSVAISTEAMAKDGCTTDPKPRWTACEGPDRNAGPTPDTRGGVSAPSVPS